MITLRPITDDNYEEVVDTLEVTEEQQEFVADNMDSLAEAYVYWTQTGLKPIAMAIYSDDAPVGFAQFCYETPESNPENIGEPIYFFWRFMIDKNHQGKGYGKTALAKVIEMIRTKPLGKANWLYTSVVPESPARQLYLNAGFVETGDVDEGENVMRMPI
ncbi:MAG: GNAT family N-acetyltransferase [Defluviitaleaceae bacterium]|nr:GNAT family N-acetyltransferase [Defluviitaleaceae bacterium]